MSARARSACVACVASVACACLLAASSACDRQGDSVDACASLTEGHVAAVGDVAIPSVLVAGVAGAKGVSPSAALSELVDDAVAAVGARAEGLDRTTEVRREIANVRARASLAKLRSEARATPPTPDEVDEFTHFRWREVDLGEQVVVVHAIVMRAKADAGADEEGHGLARAIRAATVDVDTTAFEATAKAVPAEGREVRVESLSPFVLDGRIAVQGDDGALDKTFAAAAFALPRAGATSDVIETSYGFHVIRLVERLPGKVVPPDERAAYFEHDIHVARARRSLDGLLKSARQRMHPELDPGADGLLSELEVSSP